MVVPTCARVMSAWFWSTLVLVALASRLACCQACCLYFTRDFSINLLLLTGIPELPTGFVPKL